MLLTVGHITKSHTHISKCALYIWEENMFVSFCLPQWSQLHYFLSIIWKKYIIIVLLLFEVIKPLCVYFLLILIFKFVFNINIFKVSNLHPILSPRTLLLSSHTHSYLLPTFYALIFFLTQWVHLVLRICAWVFDHLLGQG